LKNPREALVQSRLGRYIKTVYLACNVKMMIEFLILLSFVAFSHSQNCSICGDGKIVGKPNAIFVFPGRPDILCGLMQEAGISGELPYDHCSYLRHFIRVCECKPGSQVTDAPTTDLPTTSSQVTNPPITNQSVFNAPVVIDSITDAPITGAPVTLPPIINEPIIIEPEKNVTINDPPIENTPVIVAPMSAILPTNGPIISTTRPSGTITSDTHGSSLSDPDSRCPDVPAGSCSICGKNKCVGNAEATFAFPGQPKVSCGFFQKAGLDGAIPIGQCSFMRGVIHDICDCKTSMEVDKAIP